MQDAMFITNQSIPTFTGYKRNCIFFNDQNETHVFNLEDRCFGDLQNIHPSQLLSNLLQAYVRQYTSKNFLFGDLNLKQRNRKRMCNATLREKRVRDILFSTRDDSQRLISVRDIEIECYSIEVDVEQSWWLDIMQELIYGDRERTTTSKFFLFFSFLYLGMKYELVLRKLVGLIFIQVFGLHLVLILKINTTRCNV